MEYKVTNEHINEYISGELTGSDLVEFEKLLVADKELQQQIRVHQQIDTILFENYFEVNRFNEADYNIEKERLNPIFKKMNEQFFVEEDERAEKKVSHNELNVIDSEEKNNSPKNTTVMRRLIPLVALAAAAAFLFFIINPFADQISPTQLADQYFESYTLGTLMGEEDRILEGSPKALLAKGSEQYGNNQFESAIQTFKKITINNSLVYESKANWYIGLCYLKLNKPQAAKPIFRQLQQSTDYKDKAKAILKQLE